ncbi:MAG: metal-dependent hydrolase [Verrucomicrobia bacterium]|nr:MAG: metal-dependent hydrolase [Verrucomicrobiota bacterium]
MCKVIALAHATLFDFLISMETQLTWYGHAAFKIETASGKILLIDPWLTNPSFPGGKDALTSLDRVDLILLTHGHSDHVGNAVEIGKRTGAALVTNFDLNAVMISVLGYPETQTSNETTGHLGGELSLLDGEVRVQFVPAWHGSSVQRDGDGSPVYAGNPTGLILTLRDGPTIYHTGDTDLFSDMALVKRFHKIDVMLVCIGDHFTMGPARAAEAVNLVAPNRVVPMHYGTFPVLTGTPEMFEHELQKRKIKSELRIMKIGEAVTLRPS